MSKPLTDEEIDRYEKAWEVGDLCDDNGLFFAIVNQAREANRLRDLLARLFSARNINEALGAEKIGYINLVQDVEAALLGK